MGAVRVNVKLINEIDRKLVNRGLLNPNLLRSYEAEALVDTGSSSLVIPMDVAEYLGLKMVERQMVTYADGREEIVSLTGRVILYISGFDTVQTALATGNQVLIGQTVLEDLDLLVDCKNHRLIPNRCQARDINVIWRKIDDKYSKTQNYEYCRSRGA